MKQVNFVTIEGPVDTEIYLTKGMSSGESKASNSQDESGSESEKQRSEPESELMSEEIRQHDDDEFDKVSMSECSDFTKTATEYDVSDKELENST